MHGVCTFSTGVREFLDFCRIEKGLAANTMEAYARDLERFRSFFGAADELPDARAWDGISILCTMAGLSGRSIARHMTTLRGVYGFLLREGRIGADPTALLPLPRQWKNIPKYLNEEEIGKILTSPDTTRPTGVRDRAMLELLYASGLRVSELCSLLVTDLASELGVVRVTGKGNKQRMVPVGRSALEAMQEYLACGASGSPSRQG